VNYVTISSKNGTRPGQVAEAASKKNEQSRDVILDFKGLRNPVSMPAPLR
jgi:hypothetical protein